MADISIDNINQELEFFLRNKDILTITERGVQTATATGTFASDSSLVINVANVKNIRSITVAGSPLTFGTDYTVDTDFNSNTQCKITFTVAQTGAYSIPYDYGSDRIFSDWPKDDVKIGSFPRIGFDIIGGDTVPLGLTGPIDNTSYDVSFVAYDQKKSRVNEIIASIRSNLRDNRTSGFFYFNYIVLSKIGPMIPAPTGQNKVIQRNQDGKIMFIMES